VASPQSRPWPPGGCHLAEPANWPGSSPTFAVLLSRLWAEGRLPQRARLALGGALAYVFSPVQLIPNFVPVIGQTDELVVVTAALRYACRRLPRNEVEAAGPGDPLVLDRLLGKKKATSSHLENVQPGNRSSLAPKRGAGTTFGEQQLPIGDPIVSLKANQEHGRSKNTDTAVGSHARTAYTWMA
jgi:uncharacterized membrane protein YkvA (DUF1232 family)